MFKHFNYAPRRTKIDAALASLGITTLCLIVVYTLARLYVAGPS